MNKFIFLFFIMGITAALADNFVSIDQVASGNSIQIRQQGDHKSAAVEMNNSSDNTIIVHQYGTGSDNLTISNTGANNTVTAIQGSSNGIEKKFQLNLNTSDANVLILQTNPNINNSGSMSINCLIGCTTSTYQYIRK